MGIIIIDPPKKPKAADTLTDSEWRAVWAYCSTQTQASLPLTPPKPVRCGAACVAWGIAAFVIGSLSGGLIVLVAIGG